MIVESVAALLEYDLLDLHNHDELVSLRTIIHYTELFFAFDRESIFQFTCHQTRGL